MTQVYAWPVLPHLSPATNSGQVFANWPTFLMDQFQLERLAATSRLWLGVYLERLQLITILGRVRGSEGRTDPPEKKVAGWGELASYGWHSQAVHLTPLPVCFGRSYDTQSTRG